MAGAGAALGSAGKASIEERSVFWSGRDGLSVRRIPPKFRSIMQLIRAIILFEIVVLLSGPARAQTTKELNTVADVYAAIRACWKTAKISGPADLGVRLSFTRDGKILGKARVTYENKTAAYENRLRFRVAVMDAFKRCTPLSFSPGLGDAVAGRPFNFRFTSNSGSGA